MRHTHKPILLSMFLAFRCIAGSSSGGGGDMYDPAHTSAWFLGNGTVRYCMDVANNFGVPQNELNSNVEKAFQLWFEYINKKNINIDPHAIQNGINFASKRQLMAQCDGSEDLKLYFGTTNLEIEMAKQLRVNPVSFAQRNSYDPVKGWGKGYIWFAAPGTVFGGTFPNWTKPNHLLAMLLHELGHVLGCGHSEGTIMTEFIGTYLLKAMNFPEIAPSLEKIDETRELILCQNGCKSIYTGGLGNFQDPKSAAETYQRLTGRVPHGAVSAWVNNIDNHFSLSVTDESGTVDAFNLSIEGTTGFEFNHHLFQAYRSTATSGTVSAFPASGEVLRGKFQAVDGKQYPVQLYRNSSEKGSPMLLRYTAQNQEKGLFWTQSVQLP